MTRTGRPATRGQGRIHKNLFSNHARAFPVNRPAATHLRLEQATPPGIVPFCV